MDNKLPAVVLSLFDTGLYTIRALGREGIPVYGYDYNPDQPGFFSKFQKKSSLCPHPYDDPEGLADFLLKEFREHDHLIPVFPASDEFVRFVSEFREKLSEKFDIFLPEGEIVESILDKNKLYDLICSYEIELPGTFAMDIVNKNSQILKNLRFPVIVKPVDITNWKKFYKQKVVRIETHADIKKMARQLAERKIKAIAQEIIPGDCTNNYETAYYFNRNHQCVSSFCFKKIRQYPADFGYGCLVESINNKKLERLGESLLKDLNWIGYANIEFKYDTVDHTFKLIEINARVWQQIGFAEKLGLNFPMYQYNESTGISGKVQREYLVEKKWMDPIPDCMTSMKKIRQKEINLREWLRSLRKIRSYAIIAADDMKPFLVSIKYGAVLLKAPFKFFKGMKKNEN